MVWDWKEAARRTPMYAVWRSRRDIQDLRRWTDRDQAAAAFYEPFVTAGSICFDVGATIGNRLKVFRRLGARVVAVEPQPRCAKVLRAVFGRDRDVILVEAALGAQAGRAELHVGTAHTIATLSSEWMRHVQATGRFSSAAWRTTISVPLTTLDALIGSHGEPAYVKIDVEGFEESVLAGLSRPVPVISFEFTPEHLDATMRCLDRVESLGSYEGCFTLGESFAFDPSGWSPLPDLRRRLERHRQDRELFGDVFVRRVQP
jgi:FkbM family methyltransferase